MKLFTVIGVRPQFIKAAPVCRAVRERGVEEILVHTGQHHDPEMSTVFFEELGIPAPSHHLGIHGGTHGAMTGAMLEGLERLMISEQPGAVMVYGDTNSTMAGALAAAKLHIPVVHVEAGLRSFNRRMPEELNRICTDHLSDLLFCSSDEGVTNLKNEGITRGVHLAGDVMADALQQAMVASRGQTDRLERLTTLEERAEGFALMTAHRAENTDDPARLAGLFEGLRRWGGRAIFPVHARTRNVMAIWAEFGPILERLLGKKIEVARDDWRPGDQKVFYADFRKAQRELGWEPKIDLEKGIEMLFNWVKENRELF